MVTVTRVQIQDEAVCISHSANALGKSMNPTILPLAMGEIGQTKLFNLGMATGIRERKLH